MIHGLSSTLITTVVFTPLSHFTTFQLILPDYTQINFPAGISTSNLVEKSWEKIPGTAPCSVTDVPNLHQQSAEEITESGENHGMIKIQLKENLRGFWANQKGWNGK